MSDFSNLYWDYELFKYAINWVKATIKVLFKCLESSFFTKITQIYQESYEAITYKINKTR